MTDRFRLAGFAAMFVSLAVWAGVVVAVALVPGCTSSQAATGAQVATSVCDVGTVLLDEPGLTPVCALISEIESVVAAWREAKGVSLQPKTKADLQKAVLAMRAKDAGK